MPSTSTAVLNVLELEPLPPASVGTEHVGNITQIVRRGAGTEELAQDQTKRSGVWMNSFWASWSAPYSLKYQLAVEPGHPSLLAEVLFPVSPSLSLLQPGILPDSPSAALI